MISKTKIFAFINTVFFLTLCCANALQIKPPIGWRQISSPKRSILMQFISNESEQGFTPNLTIATDTPNQGWNTLNTSKALGDYVANLQARAFPNFKVKQQKMETIGNVSGVLIVSSFAYGKNDIGLYQFVFREGDHIVSVIYLCLNEDLSKFSNEFEKSLGTLH